jgi:hypothetical protein
MRAIELSDACWRACSPALRLWCAGIPRGSATVPLLLGLDGRQYLAFRALVRRLVRGRISKVVTRSKPSCSRVRTDFALGVEVRTYVIRSNVPSIPPKQRIDASATTGLRGMLGILRRGVPGRGSTGACSPSGHSTESYAICPCPHRPGDADSSGLDMLCNKRRAAATQVVRWPRTPPSSGSRRDATWSHDFIAKPLNSEISALLSKALETDDHQRERAAAREGAPPQRECRFEGAVAKLISDIVRKAAATRTTVLITGSGTGKGSLHARCTTR